MRRNLQDASVGIPAESRSYTFTDYVYSDASLALRSRMTPRRENTEL